MNCTNCGNELAPNATACQNCGTPVFQQAPMIPEEYKPISMWGYLGYQILFSIPCVGLILLLVFSFGGTKNVNLKNFARSYFCFFIIALVLAVILGLIIGSYATEVAEEIMMLDPSVYSSF